MNRMLDQVHKMVLASGTLEPAGDFALLKASETGAAQPWKFSCGHVVADENYQALCIGQPFDFRYEHRSAPR